jgi:hypothetical protein
VTDRVLVLACGALARELLDIVALNRLDHVVVECLPVWYHNQPSRIPDAVRARVREARPHYDRILIGYADCGTGGRLDQVCEEERLERLPGAHCYEFFAGRSAFAEMHDDDPATFYLTDYLVKHFDRVVVSGLGIDRHPQLLDAYFGNYRRLVYLAQIDDPELVVRAQRAADRLGLEFELRRTEYGELESTVVEFTRR